MRDDDFQWHDRSLSPTNHRVVSRALGDSDPSEGVARNDTGAIVSVVRAASVIYLNGTFSLFFSFLVEWFVGFLSE